MIRKQFEDATTYYSGRWWLLATYCCRARWVAGPGRRSPGSGARGRRRVVDDVPSGVPVRAVRDVAEAERVGVERGLVGRAARRGWRRCAAVYEAIALIEPDQRVCLPRQQTVGVCSSRLLDPTIT